MRRLDSRDPGFAAAFDRLVRDRRESDGEVAGAVAAIINDVRLRGDEAVAEPRDAVGLASASHARVATKYPNLTRRHFESLGIQAECVKLNGAMELAPSLGLAGRIVDLVSTGKTLADNGLVETSVILPVSARLIVNRAALKTDPRLGALIDAFRALAAEPLAA